MGSEMCIRDRLKSKRKAVASLASVAAGLRPDALVVLLPVGTMQALIFLVDSANGGASSSTAVGDGGGAIGPALGFSRCGPPACTLVASFMISASVPDI